MRNPENLRNIRTYKLQLFLPVSQTTEVAALGLAIPASWI